MTDIAPISTHFTLSFTDLIQKRSCDLDFKTGFKSTLNHGVLKDIEGLL